MNPDAEQPIHAIIPAAGIGSRAGSSIPKQYRQILGRSLLHWSMLAVARHPRVAGITVALAAQDQWFTDALPGLSVPVHRVTGGPTRAHSVLNALVSLAENGAHGSVLVHDAVRPCLSEQDLHSLIEAGSARGDGALLAIPCSDTLKRSDADQQVTQTLDRKHIWQAQTPQMFPLDRLHQCLEEQLAAGRQPTDEASVLEAAGGRPLLVPGSASNLKVTWPADFTLAELFLKRMADNV